MSRRSARISSKPTTKFRDLADDRAAKEEAEWQQDNMSDSDQEFKAHGPKKRKKKHTSNQPKTRNVKGRRGSLKQLTEMPIDILYEIFGHLCPQDLLRLARTTKALRGILMRRSAVSVWKDVRANVQGLPDCPSDLPEPQYASLAFDPYCHLCEAPGVYTILWACRIRSCQKCLNAKFVDSHGLYRYSELMTVNARFEDLLRSARAKFGKYYTRQIYLEEDATTVSAAILAFADDKEKRDQYVKKRKEEMDVLRQHATACEQWQQGNINDRATQLQAMRDSRKEAIIDKLRELGYGPELDEERYTLTELYRQTTFKKAQELTERIWSHIKDPLIEIMERLKRERLKRNHKWAIERRVKIVSDLIKVYTANKPVDAIIPAMGDICEMPEFKTVILDPEDDVEVIEEDFKDAMERLPQGIEEWRVAKEAELVRFLDPESEPADAEHNRRQLELATTLFNCNRCYQNPISYPRILIHGCLTEYKSWQHTSPPDCDEKLLRTSASSEPWNVPKNRITTIKEEMVETVSTLLTFCGLDPEVATAQEMDERDARFECQPCWSDTRGALIMDWKTAVRHTCHNHNRESKWKLVGEIDTARVKAEEDKAFQASMKSWSSPSDFFCRHCRTKIYNHILTHVKNEHDVDDVTKDDFYRNPDLTSVLVSTHLLSEAQLQAKEAEVKSFVLALAAGLKAEEE